MILKTISGHYDTVYSLNHNNRKFIPRNVEYSRTFRNYYCIEAGADAYVNLDDPRCLAEFWAQYRSLSQAYWDERAVAKTLAYGRYRENMRRLRYLAYRLCHFPDDEVGLFVFLLCLPLIIISEAALEHQRQQLKDEFDSIKEEQWLRDMEFNATKASFREALLAHDRLNGTEHLRQLDTIVTEMARCADDHLFGAQESSFESTPMPRFATLEEIYDKLYEPSFRAFQEKQRPCRRYNGTYLQKVREDQHKAAKMKQQTKNAKNRKTAEAIEIVFGIGDMDNTGYRNAPKDAYMSEYLLKDFCDHLMQSEKVCFVTTKDLETPGWQPPFKNGLIILNLTVHCDEATPGIHLTCIPYSRACKRGPEVQAALGRAMTGMGYPSTWKDVLDEHGERVPKRDKNGNAIHNADGTVRYKQEPDGQGIIDWIEDQKRWIQNEMERRYGWQREYKGSHPRGNLSTPDYQVARAKERVQEVRLMMQKEVMSYSKQIHEITDTLSAEVKNVLDNDDAFDLVIRYLQFCSNEEYQKIVKEAADFFVSLPSKENQKVFNLLEKKIADAQTKNGSKHHAELRPQETLKI